MGGYSLQPPDLEQWGCSLAGRSQFGRPQSGWLDLELAAHSLVGRLQSGLLQSPGTRFEAWGPLTFLEATAWEDLKRKQVHLKKG